MLDSVHARTRCSSGSRKFWWHVAITFTFANTCRIWLGVSPHAGLSTNIVTIRFSCDTYVRSVVRISFTTLNRFRIMSAG